METARRSWKGQLVLSQSEPVPYGSSWNNIEGSTANQTLVPAVSHFCTALHSHALPHSHLWMFGHVLDYL
jgi:hypothetical protein